MNNELKQIIKCERELYIPHIKSLKNKIMAWYTHAEEYRIFRYISMLRKAEYYKDRSKFFYAYWLRKMNILGEALGFFIPAGVLGRGVKIFHSGNIIINSFSIVGDGCLFHGDNCIGNNGLNNKCPVLGKNIELGIGAKIIGDVTLADNITIGANAVVTKSFLEPGITIAGVPAKKIR